MPAKLEDTEKFQFQFFAVIQFCHKINFHEIIRYRTLFLRELYDNIINTRRDRQTGIETDRLTDRQTGTHKDPQTDRHMDRQIDRQTHRQTDAWID